MRTKSKINDSGQVPAGLILGWKLARLRKVPSNTLACPVCRKTFIRRGNRKFNSKKVCCSVKCAASLRHLDTIPGFNIRPKKGLVKICPTCRVKFQKPPSVHQKYCSNTCRSKDPRSFDAIRGASHYNWKGGITTENIKLRNSIKGREWTMSVFRRDNFTCQICRRIGRRKTKGLNAHHKKHWSLFPELRFDVSNGITLCGICHKTLHMFGRHFTRKINLTLENGNYDDFC